MAELIGDFWRGMPWYLYVILILCFGLMVASFVVPPVGTIGPSVLQGVAEILGFTWLLYVSANIPVFIEKGAKIKASYGNASIEIGRNKKKNEVQLSEEQPEKEEQEDA